MKVDTTKLKKGSSDLTPECRLLIDRIINCRTRKETMDFLETVQVWIYGKCELYHWIEILDRFDKILEEAACHDNGNEFVLNCDITFATEDTRLLLLVLNFTTLLIEHSFSRHLYNSIEHLTKLLSSQNMDIVLAVLNLLYMFSKRSNFIPRLPLDKKETLLIKLFNIAERWGDPNYGLALIDCCMKKPKLNVLYQLSLEYVDDNGQIAFLEIPDMVDVSYSHSTSTIVKIICDQLCCPSVAVKMRIAHRARLISGFMDCKLRLQYVQARLQAVSVLIYSNALQENAEKVLYSGFGEELCELIDKEDNHLVDIRAAVLRTLTSMLHFDRNHNVPKPGSRLPKIIHYTGAERQGGILPLLVRDCISSLTGSGVKNKYPINLATALFSLLYHLASYEAGGQALLKSGMMQSLLCVINWADIDLEHITFVTRAVRVIDLITNIDIAKFHQNNGLNTFIDRLEKEVKICREAIANAFVGSNYAHPNKIKNLVHDKASGLQDDIAIESGMASTSYMSNAKRRRSSDSDMILLNVNESPKSFNSGTNVGINADVFEGSDPQIGSKPDDYPSNSYYARPLKARPLKQVSNFDNQHIKKLTCTTQRAALLKSMLNFLKKSIQDHTNYNGMRNVMETTLPCSLRHIISKAEYYGPSLFLLATDVVTVYVFNEPSLLSSLQDYGITNVILQSLLKKEVPATREVLGSLPNVFSALCLNERGLLEFMAYEPFDKLFNVLLSPDYLVAMRRRRSSDPLGDTATNLGNAMDDLMKHHPYLRTDATEAIVRLLNELVRLGTDPNFICWRANRDNNSGIISGDGGSDCSSQKHQEQNLNTENSAFEDRSNDNEHGFSGEEDDDDEDISSASQQQTRQNRSVMKPQTHIRINSEERVAIPLIDYILNVMKFIEAIFSNSSNGEHCREFALHGGLKPLIKLLSLPNLPVDSPVSTTAQAVANVCKSILNLAHETKVIDIALLQLSQIVTELKPLINHGSLPGGSVLLCELLACPKLDDGFCNADYTPLLHNMSSVHGYVVMLVHICRNASPEMRSILLQRWGLNCSSGLQLLQNLVQLYISLVWESTVLLNLCSDDPVPHYSHLDGDEIIQSSSKEKCDVLKKKNDFKPKLQISNCNHKGEKGHLTKTKVKLEEQLRYIKSLLAASSRLGRALAELFGTLVKLSVGTPQSRQRRNNDCLSNAFNKKIPSSDAKEIARVLSSILVNGFCHETFVPKSSPKLKLTFLICSVGFTGPMLFDDKRNGFHLMISQFCKESGLQAFFNMFSWAISIGNEDICGKQSYMNIENISEDRKDDELDFPEGTGEFLDAWLQLLEKMVNPRAIIDSPYALATVQQPRSPESINFEPIFYLVKVHQLAMLAIKRIWKRKPISNYGVSMTETIMTILKHLIKSNKMLSDRFITRMNEISNENKLPEKIISSQDPKDESTVNADHLKILTDMGFLKQHVHEALTNTRSIEQATDYLLNHSVVSDLNVSREAENVNLSAPNSCNEMEVNLSALPSTTKAGLIIKPDSSSSKEKTNILEENKNLFGDLKLIPNEIFSKFCFDTQERVFSFMEFLPETVNTGADLLSMLYRYQNQVDKSTFLTNLVKSITRWSNQVLQNIKGNFSFNRHKQAFVTGMMDTKLFIRFKIATLLLDDIYSDTRKDLFNIICKENCLNSVICLLNKTTLTLQEQVTLSIRPITPRWLQSLVEFVDAVDSVNVILQRKINMRAVCSDVWKWYDTSTGKWNIYSDANNTIIKNAFNSGERSVVITIGRQRYTVNFSCMTQVSEASGSHRPVMPALKITEAIAMCNHNPNSDVENILTNIIKSDIEKSNVIQQEVNLSLNSLLNISGNNDEYIKVQPNNGEPGDIDSGNLAKDLQTHTNLSKKMQTKEVKSNKKPVKHQKIVIYEEPIGFAKHNTAELIKCIVCLLKPSMLLNFETKLSFLKLCARLTKNHENAKIFVNQGGIDLLLNMKQSCGLIGFPTYAIIIIRHILETPTILQESIERVLLARTAPSLPIGHRDLLFVLTQVSSAVARNPQVFLNASKQILRCDYAPNSAFSFDDSKFLVKAHVPNNRKDSALLCNSDTSNNASVKVIKYLLNAIVQPCIHYGGVPEKHNETKNQGEQESDPGLYDNSNKDPPSSCISNKLQEKYGLCCCSWHIPSTSHNHEKPVLPRATIIKILADAVRSYQSLVPRIIIEHIYKPSDSILIEKEQTCLSFILENFLPILKQQQDAEVSVMSRVLISSLVDCYGYTFIQSMVAEEVHKAIVRAIFLPDSTEKNTRLQVLLGLLPTMIESPMLINKVHVQRNNMYRVLLRQGIMTDLSKIAQYSDLSKSSTFASVFATLRPMEILLRLTVAPGALSAKRLLFGNSLQGTNQNTNRRFFPRLAPRSATITNSTTFGGDHVLRDIIRNVLSDRRHGFEFIFNPENIIVDSESTSNAAGISADDGGEDIEQNPRFSSVSRRQRSQLNFDRLLDDYMQNERNFQNLTLGNRNTSSSNSSAVNTGIVISDHHRHTNNLESVNNDNGEGGSDGASTSSEIAAVTVDNIIADVSTSDSNDSDSNISTENDDRNDEENEEDDDEDDGNEECADDPSETDAEDETRQFIEVFDHIYERESSETASNYADVDADDEASELGGGVNGATISQSMNTDIILSEPNISNEDHDRNQFTNMSTQQLSSCSINTTTALTDMVLAGERLNSNDRLNDLSTTVSWDTPRMTLSGDDVNIDGEVGAEYGSNISNGITPSPNALNDRYQNSIASGGVNFQPQSSTTNSQNSNNIHRRDSIRRLLYLDQQYCAPMPSFNSPTEEGQIELFNQDALHWWLEEAKQLDFESQTNACLYVGHFLIPYLINEFKTTHRQNNKHENPNTSINSACTNRRSSIPVLMQHVNNSSVSSDINPDSSNNRHALNTSLDHFQESSSASESIQSESLNIPPLLNQNNVTASSLQAMQANIDLNSDVFVFHNYNAEERLESTPLELSESTIRAAENSINESLEINTNNHNHNQEVYTSTYGEINTRLVGDEAEATDDDINDENKEDEMNTTFIEDELNELNVDLNTGIQNVLLQSRTQSSDDEIVVANATPNENNENSEIEFNIDLGAHGSSVPPVTRNIVNMENNDTELVLDLPVLNTETSTGIIINAEAAPLSSSSGPLNIAVMSSELRATLGGLEVPDGVDPSFLAALPEEMREEVIQEFLRMQRVRQRAQQNAMQVAHDSLLEVSPEFLAALPPNIQSEVLMQQRIEQQRQAAQTANPEDPVDAGAFFQNLPDSLRQAILTDMDESQIASLPPELAAEAQYLRRDWENRNNMRLDSANSINALRSTARGGYLTARFPSSLQNLSEDSRWRTNSIWYDANGTPHEEHHHHTTIIHQHPQFQGKPIALLLMEDENKLLDPDSLTTLLLFLFIEDSKLNFTRLQRIIRNLCFHVPTREWIINALISIIQRTKEEEIITHVQIKPQWLNLRVEAVLGYKSNIFVINKINDAYFISINPQAVQTIVHNCLEMLFVLAKYFPRSFVPYIRENKIPCGKDDVAIKASSCTLQTNNDLTPEDSRQTFQRRHLELNENSQKSQVQEILGNEIQFDECPSTSRAASAVRTMQIENTVNSKNKFQYNANAKDFWDVLLNIDINTQNRFCNLYEFPINSQPSWKWEHKNFEFMTFKDSIFAKLTEMLAYKVICRSPQLTDMLIKLLALLSADLPKDESYDKYNADNCETLGLKPHNSDVVTSEISSEVSTTLSHEDKQDLLKNEPVKCNKSKRKIYTKNYSHLQYVIEVLTHRCGTTEGLDNVAKLIFNLCQCSLFFNGIFLQYLTSAILGLAKEVQQSIQNLLSELRCFNLVTKENAIETKWNNAQQVHEQGIMHDRFTAENIVISAPTNIKPSFELQLPAMKKLLSATSAQPYFLRTLKILIQVRELSDMRKQIIVNNEPTLSQIIVLDNLWSSLSECLIELEGSKDEYAVLVLQPTVEAFFLIHATRKESSKSNKKPTQENNTNNVNPPSVNDENLMDLETNNTHLSTDGNITKNSLTIKINSENLSEHNKDAQLQYDRLKFLSFAEKHRTVLNQILRQSPIHLSDGPFAVLVDHTRILDFDVKRKYFQTELERIDEGVRREESTVSVRRVTVFEDSFRVLYRLGPEEWKNRFYIVFEDEEGQDAGGLLREWYVIISREIFNPMYALFCVSPGDRVTYMINPSSYANPNHLSYFKFVGRVIAKAIHDNKLLECYFTRSFYKHILGKHVKYTDMESQDYEFYKGLDYLMKNNISTLGYELTFSTEVQEFGVTQVRDLIPKGRDIVVTEENKFDYVQLVCQLKMSGSIRQQLDAFLEGFYDIIPKHLISIFNEQELELLISGLPDIDIEDLKANTEYHKYTSKSAQIQWFWRALRSFDQADRAKFLQFVTGTSKVPLQGFRLLEGMNGIQKFQIHRDDRSTDRLPCAHTCFNQLDLPMYKSYEKLRSCLLKAIHECSEGFGFA